MHKLDGIKLGAAMLLLSCTANAAVIIDNQQIPTEDIVAISISPTTGNLFIDTTVGYTVAPSGVTATPPPGKVAINSFTASPTTFVEGGSTSLSWATQNATYCTPSNGTASWLNENVTLASGSANVQINAPGNYAFSLTCTGADGETAFKNLTVSVSAEPTTGSTQCNSASLTGTTKNWSGFWGSTFPGPNGLKQVTDTIPRTGYTAYKFNTGSATGYGSVVSLGITNSGGIRLGSISECPGDFDVSTFCKQTWGIGSGLAWSTGGINRTCQLEKNKDYYLNITFTDGVSPDSTSCTGWCQVKLQYSR